MEAFCTTIEKKDRNFKITLTNKGSLTINEQDMEEVAEGIVVTLLDDGRKSVKLIPWFYISEVVEVN